MPAPELRIGSRVVVERGPFAGREGVVEAIDEKGGIRVRLGSVVARCELGELTVVGRVAAGGSVRPSLQSSHRRGPSRKQRG